MASLDLLENEKMMADLFRSTQHSLVVSKEKLNKLKEKWVQLSYLKNLFLGPVHNRQPNTWIYILRRLQEIYEKPYTYTPDSSGTPLSFNNKPWSQHVLPCDADIVATFFCRFLEMEILKSKDVENDNHLFQRAASQAGGIGSYRPPSQGSRQQVKCHLEEHETKYVKEGKNWGGLVRITP